MKVESYKNLIVWQKGIDLAVSINYIKSEKLLDEVMRMLNKFTHELDE